MLLHTPSRREDHKVSHSNPRAVARTRQHSEDGRILGQRSNDEACTPEIGRTHWMVKGDRIHHHELGEVILVGVVVAMPTHHIKGGVALEKTQLRPLYHF